MQYLVLCNICSLKFSDTSTSEQQQSFSRGLNVTYLIRGLLDTVAIRSLDIHEKAT